MACTLLGSIGLLLLCVLCTAQEETPHGCLNNSPSNGFFTERRNEFSLNENVRYRCQSGYTTPNGDQEGDAQCLATGWSPEPKCIKIVCSPPQILNGSFEPEQLQYEYQESINTLCGDGYKSSGTSMCTARGWQPPPACIPKQCEYPRIQNGRLYYDEPEAYFPKREGYRLDFRCNNGFLAADKNYWQRITCTKNGWNPEPKCFRICDHNQEIQHGILVFPWRATFIEGNEITVHCDEGYYPANQQTRVNCTKNGWSPTPRCVPREAKQCEYPRIQNGRLYYNEPEAYFPKREGYRLDFRCNNGFLAADKNYWQRITCTKNGWNPEPKCFKQCDPSQQIQHGRLLYSRAMIFIEGNEISVHCDMGYYPANQQTTFKCTNNGWSPTPRCVSREETERKCDRPPSIENGDITEMPKKEYNSGDSVQYKCQRFYRMEGTPVVSCLNGHWSETPRCIVPCTTSQEDMQRNNIRFKWSRDEKMYTESGDLIEFSCRWGYHPAPSSPPFRAQCIDGTFEYPQCI